jgi:neutral ceramidase
MRLNDEWSLLAGNRVYELTTFITIQRYEAGSVIYGRYTLLAYTTELKNLARALILGQEVDPGTPNDDPSEFQIECLTPPGIDLSYGDIQIGEVLEQPESHLIDENLEGAQYEFSATFVGANPRNILYQKTFNERTQEVN